MPVSVFEPRPRQVTAASAHQFLIALAWLLGFVIVMTMLAGLSPQWGRSIVAFFVALLVLQAITHKTPFLDWVQNVQLVPPGTPGAP